MEDLNGQNSLIKSFLDMVQAKDGDFGVIAELSEATSDQKSFDLMIDYLCKNPQCQKAFDENIRLNQVNLQDLHQLPKNTLGFCYADNLIQKGLTPLPGKEVNNVYQYLGNHLTETHDIWHIVTGCDTDILGEIQLEAFYVGQLYASRFWLALIAKNLLKLVLDDIEKSSQYMDAITQGWIMAKQAKPLLGIQWDLYWEMPLDEVRRSLNIIIT